MGQDLLPSGALKIFFRTLLVKAGRMLRAAASLVSTQRQPSAQL